MSEGISELQHNSARALEKADEAGLDIRDLQRDLKCAAEELGYLKTFSRKLLELLKLKFQLNDQELGELLRQADKANARLIEKPGSQTAPLCVFCERPLQEDSESCIYCGRMAA